MFAVTLHVNVVKLRMLIALCKKRQVTKLIEHPEIIIVVKNLRKSCDKIKLLLNRHEMNCFSKSRIKKIIIIIIITNIIK